MKKNKIIFIGMLAAISALSVTSIALSSAALASKDKTTEKGDKNDGGISITISGAQTVEVGSSINLAISVLNDNDRLGYNITSSDNTIATVSGTGSVTGVKPGQVTITVTSRKDEKVSKTYVITVIESTIPSLKIETDNKSTTLNGGGVTFRANLNNPSNYDVQYVWSAKYGKGTFEGNGRVMQTYRPFIEGPEMIVLDAYVGPYHLHQEMPFLIRSEISGSWKAIDNKDDFLSVVNGQVSNTGKYYLTSDIDLGGAKVGVSSATEFLGTLDGFGHKVSNFVVAGGGDCGLFKKLGKKAAVRHLALEGELGSEATGWGAAFLAGAVDGAYIENCSFTVNDTYDNSINADSNGGWFPFNAVIAGSGSAIINDCVVNIVDGCEGYLTIYADFAYPAEGQGVQGYNSPSITVNGLYTNTTVIGGQQWDWGLAVMDQSGYCAGLNFDSTSKDTYKLNDLVWNLEDNQMPTLKTLN